MLGGVVVAYNVSGVKSGLKLDGATTAKIFQGEITKWNDPAITSLNPGVTLPDTPISVVHRSDESGTTFVFTSWLSSQSTDWEKKVGADKAVSWPTGTGGDGNDGVAAGISQTDGSIGYLSYDFAVSSGLGIADIQRDDGTFVDPVGRVDQQGRERPDVPDLLGHEHPELEDEGRLSDREHHVPAPVQGRDGPGQGADDLRLRHLGADEGPGRASSS